MKLRAEIKPFALCVMAGEGQHQDSNLRNLL